MIFPSNRVRILVATQPVDFRKGHDGLTALVQSVLRKDPFTGTVFVFRARRMDRLKLLYVRRQGFSECSGCFVTEALVRFLFKVMRQRCDGASGVSGWSVS
jgi:hypothetical protein